MTGRPGPPLLRRLAALAAGLWAGLLVCITVMAAPAAFAVLQAHDAGLVAGRLFAQEAYLGLVLAVLLLVLERKQARERAAAGQGSAFSAEVLLLLAALFCTVAGYFALQPMIAAAHAGQGAWSFGALHAVSGGLFALKALLVIALAWRLTAR